MTLSPGASRAASFLDVGRGVLDLFGVLLRQPQELVDARRAAELVRLAADDPAEPRVGLGVRDRADAVARLRVGVVRRAQAGELLRRRLVAVGGDVFLGVLAAGPQ